MNKPTIAILGGGSMGSSLVGGLIKNNYPSDKLWLADPSEIKLSHLEHQFGIHTTTSNLKAIGTADIIIFAVKPQVLAQVAKEIKDITQLRQPLVISVAAGIREASLQTWLGGNIAIVRCMPNTPALIGCGASGLFANNLVSSVQHEMTADIMRAIGLIVWVEDEKLMDVVTAVSGSGPAYFLLFMEILQEVAEELGLPANIARMLTLQTALGSARMALESPESTTELRRRVTSPGGTTEQALNVFEKSDIRQIFSAALQAAHLRAEELANTLG